MEQQLSRHRLCGTGQVHCRPEQRWRQLQGLCSPQHAVQMHATPATKPAVCSCSATRPCSHPPVSPLKTILKLSPSHIESSRAADNAPHIAAPLVHQQALFISPTTHTAHPQSSTQPAQHATIEVYVAEDARSSLQLAGGLWCSKSHPIMQTAAP